MGYQWYWVAGPWVSPTRLLIPTFIVLWRSRSLTLATWIMKERDSDSFVKLARPRKSGTPMLPRYSILERRVRSIFTPWSLWKVKRLIVSSRGTEGLMCRLPWTLPDRWRLHWAQLR